MMARYLRNRRRYLSYREQHRTSRKISKILKYLVLIFILYQVVTLFLFSSYFIKTDAMEPAILNNQKILASPIVFGAQIPGLNVQMPGFRSPLRGDIVMMTTPNRIVYRWYLYVADSIVRFFTFQRKTVLPGSEYSWNNQIVIKRVIGIPGDTIKIENYAAYIKPAGTSQFVNEFNLIQKKYSIQKGKLPGAWDKDKPFSGYQKPITLKDDEYYVLNDNRSDLNDSRFFGSVSKRNIKSMVFLRYLPGFSFPR